MRVLWAALALLTPGTALAAGGDLDLTVAYRAEACLACHGAPNAAMPALVGRPAGEIAAALSDYRDGRRTNAIMNAAAHALDDGAIAALAAYLASDTGRAP